MGQDIQFDRTFHSDSEPMQCAQCEERIFEITGDEADAPQLNPAIGLTRASQQGQGLEEARLEAAFDRHLAGCLACRQLLADAQRGAAWLGLLKSSRPEPSTDLFARIIANTSGSETVLGDSALTSTAVHSLEFVSSAYHPSIHSISSAKARLLKFPRRFVSQIGLRNASFTGINPRLAMTAAMAFFSVSLTMSLLGIRTNELKKVGGLTTASLERSFYQADASVIRSVNNLRVVHEVESRVEAIKRDGDASSSDQSQPTQAAPSSQPEQPAPASSFKPAGPISVGPATVSPRTGTNPSTSQPRAVESEYPLTHESGYSLTRELGYSLTRDLGSLPTRDLGTLSTRDPNSVLTRLSRPAALSQVAGLPEPQGGSA